MVAISGVLANPICGSAIKFRITQGGIMVRVGILARLRAKPGKENEVQKLLEGALPLAQAEKQTQVWFAFRVRPEGAPVRSDRLGADGQGARVAVGPAAARAGRRARGEDHDRLGPEHLR